jgi:tRNA pseudouridine38-40 synthase
VLNNWNSFSANSNRCENNRTRNRRGRRLLSTHTAAAEGTTQEINNNNNNNNNSSTVYGYSSTEEEVIRKYKLPYKYIAEVAYDGTRYNGFQLQKSSLVEEPSSTLIITTSSNLKNNKRATHPPPTIQGKLETALTRFLGINRDDLLLQGAGRTDAGVHARGQVVHFFSKRRVEDTNRAVRALNSLLPEDIHVLRLLRVPLDYNVRFSMGKIYTYDLHLDPLGSDPFTQRYRLCPKALLNSKTFEKNTFNLEALSSAAAVFVGTHDFSVFSSKPRDKSQRSVERTIRRCEITSAPSLNMAFSDPLLRIEIEGDGFLYKQVRHMVGAMLAAASGRITSENISKALADPVNRGGMEGGALARSGAYILAEPHGLCLKKVFLPDPPGNPEELMYGEQGPILKRRNELLEFFDK